MVTSSVSSNCGVSCAGGARLERHRTKLERDARACRRPAASRRVSMRAVRLNARVPSRSTVPPDVAPRSGASTATRVTAAVSVRASICSGPKCARVERDVRRRQRRDRGAAGPTVPPSVARPLATDSQQPGGRAVGGDDARDRACRRSAPSSGRCPSRPPPSRVQAICPAMRPVAAREHEVAGRTAAVVLHLPSSRDRRTARQARPGRR